jgi:hypothetical protein
LPGLPRSLLPLVAAVLLLQYRCSTRGRCCGRSRRGLNPSPSTAGWVGRIANTQRCRRRRVQQPVCAAADASTPPAKVPPRLDLSLKIPRMLSSARSCAHRHTRLSTTMPRPFRHRLNKRRFKGSWVYQRLSASQLVRIFGQWHWLGTNPDSAADSAAMRYFRDAWQLRPAFDAVL